LVVSDYRLAEVIGTGEGAIGECVRGRRGISTAMAFGPAKSFDMTPEFWMNLQRDYDALTLDAGGIDAIKPLATG
jgi:addiction module HigA family antidote